MNDVKRVLVLAPHPDDGEFGAGATIAKLVEKGAEVWYYAFSPCVASVPDGFEKDVLYKELRSALQHLGIAQDHIFTADIPVRYFPSHRQAILESLVKIRKDIKPDLVLLPNKDDVHQDHHVIHQEGVRAFKHSSLIGYELPWNNLDFTSNFHMQVEEKHLDQKVSALHEYKTQLHRTYSSDDFIKGLARVRGTQVNAEYAEAFQLIRWIAR